MKLTNIIAFVAFTLMSVACTAQSGTSAKYVVNGTSSSDGATVLLIDIAGRGAVVDTAIVANNAFAFAGETDKDAILGVMMQGSRSYIVFVNDGEAVSIDVDNKTVKGSALNEKLNDYDRSVDALQSQANVYMDQYAAAKDAGASEEELAALAASLTKDYIEPIEQQVVALEKQIVSDNVDNVIAAAFICDIMYDCELAELQALLSDENAFTTHPMAQKAKRYLEALEKKMAIVGQPFVDLEMTGLDGAAHKLSDYCGTGNYVLIDFWASWCGPCRAEMPNVKANYAKYHPSGFEIVGVSFDSNDGAWRKAVDDMALIWPHISDLQGWNSAGAAAYNVHSIPSSVLVDPDGKVVAIDLRGDKLGDKLSEIYGF